MARREGLLKFNDKQDYDFVRHCGEIDFLNAWKARVVDFYIQPGLSAANSGFEFASLVMTVSAIEGIGQAYKHIGEPQYRGWGSDNMRFKKVLSHVLPNNDLRALGASLSDISEDIWLKFRCGLVHEGRIKCRSYDLIRHSENFNRI